MVIVLDDVLTDDKVELLRNTIPNYPVDDTWYDLFLGDPINHILSIVTNYVNLDNITGYETHKNVKGPPLHQDKDELLFKTKNIVSHPVCSIVYYPLIEDLKGGNLQLPGMAIKPKNNRLIIFSSNLFHHAEPHTGTRISLGINPWYTKPMAYR